MPVYPGALPGTISRRKSRFPQNTLAGLYVMRYAALYKVHVRTDLPTKRTARVLLCLYSGHLVAVHGFIKKSRKTPDEDLALARKRQKELEQ